MALLLLAGIALLWVMDRRKPINVLLITVDTTRADDLGVYGGPARTPHLQELRADGILFHHMYSVAYGTTPSHASLFTSRYAREHGVYNNRTILPTEFDTLAEIMALHGAETAAFVSSRPVCRELGLGQGFVSFDQEFKGLQRSGRKTADRFVAWLRGIDRWFFAWIHFMDAHRPYSPPPRFSRRYLPDVEEGFHRTASYRRFNRRLAAERLLREEPENFHESAGFHPSTPATAPVLRPSR